VTSFPIDRMREAIQSTGAQSAALNVILRVPQKGLDLCIRPTHAVVISNAVLRDSIIPNLFCDKNGKAI
jgi:hypothetical protein